MTLYLKHPALEKREMLRIVGIVVTSQTTCPFSLGNV